MSHIKQRHHLKCQKLKNEGLLVKEKQEEILLKDLNVTITVIMNGWGLKCPTKLTVNWLEVRPDTWVRWVEEKESKFVPTI